MYREYKMGVWNKNQTAHGWNAARSQIHWHRNIKSTRASCT